MYRTVMCNDLRKENIGQTVSLAGWVDTIRDHGEVHLNTLADALHQPVYKLMSILVELDCKHVITTLPGCRYTLA